MTTEEINYRRFFDINELAAIRVEVPEVFKATHRLVFHVLGQQEATGLRIDHPDGLWDPPAYFRRLQESYLLHCLGASGGASSVSQEDLTKTVGHWLDQQGALPCGERAWPLYVAAEKILSEDEALPTDWAVCGTTGYDFLAEVNRLLTDSSQACQFDRIYGQFTAARADFKKLANSCKKMIRLVAMAGEINALAHLLDRISEKNRRYRDFTLNSLTHGIREVIACLPVYRTYVNLLNGPSQRDEETIETAVAEARRQNPRTAHEIFDFIRDTLLLRNVEDFRPEDRPGLIEFVMKFQQLTGAVMAKGVGDTAFYIYNRLVSLNEVGARPGQFGADVEAFHRSNSERLKNWPHSMLATSTHDTKRSEDVRARIQVLSEIPKEWQAALTRWSRLNAYHRTSLNGGAAPDRNDEYLLYQTLLGAWPAEPMTPQALEQYFASSGCSQSPDDAKSQCVQQKINEVSERALTTSEAALVQVGALRSLAQWSAPMQQGDLRVSTRRLLELMVRDHVTALKSRIDVLRSAVEPLLPSLLPEEAGFSGTRGRQPGGLPAEADWAATALRLCARVEGITNLTIGLFVETNQPVTQRGEAMRELLSAFPSLNGEFDQLDTKVATELSDPMKTLTSRGTAEPE